MTSKELEYEREIRDRVEDINLDKYNKELAYKIYSRMLDILLSIIGLIISIPIILIAGLAIKVEDNGPIFYSQTRVGKKGKVFVVHKLRSMIVDAEKNGAQWAEKNDNRITKVGGFIRKTRIDELPQLINVLKGEMSIIGPRPERPNFTIQYDREIDGFIYRLSVKPGLTGWAQVNGGYDLTPKEKLELDLYYLENRDLYLDLVIIIKTIGVLCTGSGAR